MRRLTRIDRAEPGAVKRRGAWPWLLLSGLLGSLGGCTCEAPPDRAGSTVPQRCAYDAPLFAPVQTDILFVVDDSNSMVEEQEGVARELPTFVDVLQTGAGVKQSLRVGLVDTSVYAAYFDGAKVVVFPYRQAGWLRVLPAVDGGPSDGARWLTDSDAEIVPRLAAGIRGLGLNGSYQETPFESARIALTQTGFAQLLPDGGSPNAGFLRPGARLLVVAVSDEDDCSEMTHSPPRVFFNDADGQDFCTLHEDLLTPVGDYVTAFQRIDDGKGRPREILWGAIAPVARSNKVAQGMKGALGDGGSVIQNVDCPTSGGPGYRHRAMALAFDSTLTNLDSICAPDYQQSLLAIAEVAAIPQTLTLTDNVPDPRLLAVDITRATGSVQRCTLANGGISVVPATATEPPAVRFQSSPGQVDCLRRPTDTRVEVKLLCAG